MALRIKRVSCCAKPRVPKVGTTKARVALKRLGNIVRR